MAIKPSGRSESSGLDAARRIVSRAERRALERAEALRAEAEELLKLVSAQTVDAEVKVRSEFEGQIRALREEMAEASRRATVAESELEILRAQADDARTAMVSTPGDAGAEAERLAAATSATAAQIRAQAELELARAREEAVGILAAASREAGDLLTSAMAAIETDHVASESVRHQVEEELQAVSAVRQELEAALAQASQDAARLREDGIVTRDRLVDNATREAARLLDEARAESDRLVEVARSESARIVDQAHTESESIRESAQADRTQVLEDARAEATRAAETVLPDPEDARAETEQLVAAARQEAADGLNAVRRQLLSEILSLHDAMEQARESFGQFLDSADTERSGSDRAVGGW